MLNPFNRLIAGRHDEDDAGLQFGAELHAVLRVEILYEEASSQDAVRRVLTQLVPLSFRPRGPGARLMPRLRRPACYDAGHGRSVE